MPKILIVEDDESMAVALRDGFEFGGYTVAVARDGAEGLRLAQQGADLVILDVMLPKMNGLDICKQLRNEGRSLPIIMVTARGQEIDKVRGLKIGADDYVTKPFSFMELLARVEAVLRRTGKLEPPSTSCAFGDVTIDLKACEVRKGNVVVELSARELKLLRYFVEHRGEAVSRDALLDAVWDYDNPPLTRTVDMHVAKLRKKIEDDPSDPKYLVTVHRVGYKLVG